MKLLRAYQIIVVGCIATLSMSIQARTITPHPVSLTHMLTEFAQSFSEWMHHTNDTTIHDTVYATFHKLLPTQKLPYHVGTQALEYSQEKTPQITQAIKQQYQQQIPLHTFQTAVTQHVQKHILDFILHLASEQTVIQYAKECSHKKCSLKQKDRLIGKIKKHYRKHITKYNGTEEIYVPLLSHMPTFIAEFVHKKLTRIDAYVRK